MKPRVISRLGDTVGARWVRSACGLCSLGCGLEIAVVDGALRGVRGCADHPVGRGRLGPKGLGQWQANAHPSRGLMPWVRDEQTAIEATWDQALGLVTDRIQDAIARRGPSAVGFYNSGQLVLEEYYTLAKLARGGLGTPNIDSNTRLCTATAGESLVASFGADGPPGAFEDFDQADCIVLFGHNAAEQSTVLWMRIMAARDRPDPPKIIVIDPRATATAAVADLHLAVRPGTNVALIDGLLRELIARGWIDRPFIDEHTAGFAALCATVEPYTPDEVERITGVPAAELRRAAEWIGTSPRVVTTCLQGVYQSPQAMATACAVNTMHLVMGKLGKPGCAPFQFAGQPSSMNTRECGADGTYPGYRNWDNPDHMTDLARRWNVPVEILGQKPVGAPEIFEQCAAGQIEVLVVIGTNPAVSFVDRARVLDALRTVFLVVMDPYADTETCAFADVYLPTAMWAEKTGCMTNAERRCNLLAKAIEPPGEARSDFDVLVELSRRLGLADRSGQPLIAYTEPEAAFDEWRRLSEGTIPDYSGMSYEMLRARGGVQWPCNAANPDGTIRLYAKPEFPTSPAMTEDYLKDLEIGKAHSRAEYLAIAPERGRARLIAVAHEPPGDPTTAEFPFVAISGRQAYHWHTRTKTAKVPELQAAAPAPYVSVNAGDAAQLGIADGDRVRVISRRGSIEVPAKVGAVVPPRTVFVPFHYGDLDAMTSANSLTASLHDPASKQPLHKYAAVRLERVDAPPAAWWSTP